MMKFLFPKIDWNHIKVVGFDMDGTLYDEIEFIGQAYREIAKKFSTVVRQDLETTYHNLICRWMTKGSSYPHIFEEFLRSSVGPDHKISDYISDALHIFRNFKPKLALPTRSEVILNELSPRYQLFLLSDGNLNLQKEKFRSLGLDRWFPPSQVYFTSQYGKNYEKPAINILKEITLLNSLKTSDEVLYLGDRDCDEAFAKSANFQFIKISGSFAL